MTLTLDLPADLERALTVRAQARGVTVPKYLLDLAARDVEVFTPQAEAQTPAIGSPEASAAHSAQLRALMAMPAEERARVLAAQAEEYAAWCDTPEGRAEWEEMQPWLNTPGPDVDAIEAEDAAESARLLSAEVRAA